MSFFLFRVDDVAANAKKVSGVYPTKKILLVEQLNKLCKLGLPFLFVRRSKKKEKKREVYNTSFSF